MTLDELVSTPLPDREAKIWNDILFEWNGLAGWVSSALLASELACMLQCVHAGSWNSRMGRSRHEEGRGVSRMFFNEILVAFFILVVACGRAGWGTPI